ncbi:MAG: MarR family transcriptional regulator [Myxococcota bacterium]|nr:MarR family transcriptional regulator [Myxococcota bacterium]
MTTRDEAIHQAIGALQRLADLFNERRDEIARGAGLSVRQWQILEEVATEHFMPSMFAARGSVTPAAVSKLVRGLLERELIRASISTGDRRQRSFVLTAAGRKLLDGVRLTRQAAIDAVWADLPKAELLRFAKFGQKLGNRLEAYLAK